MNFHVGNANYHVEWEYKEINLPFFVQGKKLTFKTRQTNCLIKNNKDEVVVKGHAVLSPKDFDLKSEARKQSFLRAIQEFLDVNFSNRNVRRGVKQDIFDEIRKNNYSKVINIK